MFNTSLILLSSKFMAHSVIWGHLINQRQNINSKTLTIEKLCELGLRSLTKFGQAHLNNEQKIRLSLTLHFIWDFRIQYGLLHQLKILIWPKSKVAAKIKNLPD